MIWTQIKVNSVHSSQKKFIGQNVCETIRSEPFSKKNQFYKRNGKILNANQLDIWSDYFHKHR